MRCLAYPFLDMKTKTDIDPEKVVAFLQWHCQGVSRGLPAKSVVAAVTGCTSNSAMERRLREVIANLCSRGFPICSTPESGYWWAESSDEIKRVCALFRYRALTSLARASKLKKFAVPLLEGQLYLPVGAEPEIPEASSIKSTDFRSMPQVGMVIKLPDELHRLTQEFIEESGMDANEFYSRAIAVFLNCQGSLDLSDQNLSELLEAKK